jgi:hypothetical protein
MTISGGDRMTRILAEMGRRMSNRHVDVGFMGNATYPDGTSVVMVAFWNEFGKGGKQPARPFMRKTVVNKEREWGQEIVALLRATNYDGFRTLSLLGEEMQADVVDSIRNMTAPALSPVTLMLRKMYWGNPGDITGASVGEAARRVRAGETGATGTAAKPLIWTAQMLRSVTYKVKI